MKDNEFEEKVCALVEEITTNLNCDAFKIILKKLDALTRSYPEIKLGFYFFFNSSIIEESDNMFFKTLRFFILLFKNRPELVENIEEMFGLVEKSLDENCSYTKNELTKLEKTLLNKEMENLSLEELTPPPSPIEENYDLGSSSLFSTQKTQLYETVTKNGLLSTLC